MMLKRTSLSWLRCLVAVVLLQGELFESVASSEDAWKELRCWPLDVTSNPASVRCQNDPNSSPYDIPVPRDFLLIYKKWFRGGPVPALPTRPEAEAGFVPLKLPQIEALSQETPPGTTTTTTTTTTTSSPPQNNSSSSIRLVSDLLSGFINNNGCCCDAPLTLHNWKDLVDEKHLLPDVAKAVVIIKPREVERAICRAGVCGRTARQETRCRQKWRVDPIKIYLRNGTTSSEELVVEDGCECVFVQLATNIKKEDLNSNDASSFVGELVVSEKVSTSSLAKEATTISSSSVVSSFVITPSRASPITSVKTTELTISTATFTPPRQSSGLDQTLQEEDAGTVSIERLNVVAEMLNSSMLVLLSVVSRMFSLMGASRNVRNAKGMARKLEETADVIEVAAQRLLEVDENTTLDEDSSTNGDLIQLLLGSKYFSTATTTLTISTCLATGPAFVGTAISSSTAKAIGLEPPKSSTASRIYPGTYYTTLTEYVTLTVVNVQTVLDEHSETIDPGSEFDDHSEETGPLVITAPESLKSFPALTDLVQNYLKESSKLQSSRTSTSTTPPKPGTLVSRTDSETKKDPVGNDKVSDIFATITLPRSSPLRTISPEEITSVRPVLIPGTPRPASSDSIVPDANIKPPLLTSRIRSTPKPEVDVESSTFITSIAAVTRVSLTPSRTSQPKVSLAPDTFVTITTTQTTYVDGGVRPKPIGDKLSEVVRTSSQIPDSGPGFTIVQVQSSKAEVSTILSPSPTTRAIASPTVLKPTSPLPSKVLISGVTSQTPSLTTLSSAAEDQVAALSQSLLPSANASRSPDVDLGSLGEVNRIGELLTLAEKLKECLVNQSYVGENAIASLGAEAFLSKPLGQQMLLLPIWRDFAKNLILEDLGSSNTDSCLVELKDSLPLSKTSPNMATGLKSILNVSGLLIAVFEMADCVNLRTGCKALVGDDLRRRLAVSQAIEKILTESENSLVSKISLFSEVEKAVEWSRTDSDELISGLPVDTLGTLYAYQLKLKPLLESYQRACISKIKLNGQNFLSNNTAASLFVNSPSDGSLGDKPQPTNQFAQNSKRETDRNDVLPGSLSPSKSLGFPYGPTTVKDTSEVASTTVTQTVRPLLTTAPVQPTTTTTSKPRLPFGISDLRLPKQFYPLNLPPESLEKLLFGSS